MQNAEYIGSNERSVWHQFTITYQQHCKVRLSAEKNYSAQVHVDPPETQMQVQVLTYGNYSFSSYDSLNLTALSCGHSACTVLHEL